MNKNVRIAALAIPFAFSLPLAASAADTGELWEVSTAMNIPGMPAGMGSRTSRVCRAKNESPGPGRNDCKVSDLKRSGNTETMTVTCPDGTMKVEMTYNASRTEYKGVMTMTSKQGDMTMNTSGRKVGACDPQVAQAEQKQRADKMQAQAKAAQAQGAAMLAQSRQQRLDGFKKSCTDAVTEMDYRRMAGILCYGEDAQMVQHCRPATKELIAKNPQAREDLELPAEAKTVCEAKRKEFCNNLQTPAGFERAAKHERTERKTPLAKRIPQSSAFCGMKNETIAANLCSKAIASDSWTFLRNNCQAESKAAAAKLCPRAQEKEAWVFLGTFCPAQAKPLYAKSCAGRDYTSLYGAKDKKTYEICHGIGIALEGLDDRGEQRGEERGEPKKSAVDAASQGVQQGINKIKGLFGR
jgi:hypothetical protein